MQISITFTSTSEHDGFVGHTTIVREDVEDLYDLGRVYTDAARAGGFSYVEDVAFEKDDGSMIFGGF